MMPVDWFFDLRFLEFFEFVPKCVMLLFPVKLPPNLCHSWVISKGCQNIGDYINYYLYKINLVLLNLLRCLRKTKIRFEFHNFSFQLINIYFQSCHQLLIG